MKYLKRKSETLGTLREWSGANGWRHCTVKPQRREVEWEAMHVRTGRTPTAKCFRFPFDGTMALRGTYILELEE
jgi:hypothetical protein